MALDPHEQGHHEPRPHEQRLRQDILAHLSREARPQRFFSGPGMQMLRAMEQEGLVIRYKPEGQKAVWAKLAPQAPAPDPKPQAPAPDLAPRAPSPAPSAKQLRVGRELVLVPSVPTRLACCPKCGKVAQTTGELEALFGHRPSPTKADPDRHIPQSQCKACRGAYRPPNRAHNPKQLNLLELVEAQR